ncbi:MAG: class I SAM-dependent methyltransferase [Anaerolineae bacterium]|nr:class I SAM-dependent methyltransferase [Anaerolineae bacterium]
MIEIHHKHIRSHTDEIEAYDHLYNTVGIRQRDSLYLWILSLLDARPGQTLLDVSSGEGTLVRFAQQQGLHAHGIDISAAALHKSMHEYGLDTLCVSNAEHLPFASGCFDYITNVGSIEHYFDPAAAIREMSRALKMDGLACVLLPNTFSLFGNIRYVWQTGDVFDDGQPLQRYSTRLGWQTLLEENGLTPFRTLRYELEWPRTVRDTIWYLAHPLKAFRLCISPLIPVNLSNSIVYLCNRSEPRTAVQR